MEQNREITATFLFSATEINSAITYSRSVSKSSIKGFCVRIKQVFDVCQTLNFKFFWLLFYHLPEMIKKGG